MAVERTSVLRKHIEPHAAEVLSAPSAPTPATQQGRGDNTMAPPPPSHSTAAATESAPVDLPKVPVNYRIPVALRARLKTAGRKLGAQQDRDLSQNKIVEEALNEYLSKHGF